VYGRPATTFVASFIGSPPMNLFHGRVSADGSRFELGDGACAVLPPGHNMLANRACVLGLRPEHLTLGAPGLELDVLVVEALGADLLVHAQAGGQPVVVRAPAGTPVAAGQRMTAGYEAASLHWFDNENRQRIEPGAAS
jgi:sn-glycerol 3-phosphate transport system ATP-binding protein